MTATLNVPDLPLADLADHPDISVPDVDYDAAVSMHRVINTQPKERRLERITSLSVNDKRISYGCINVPADFFDEHIRPQFAMQRAPIYVLPETKSLREVFGV